MVKFIEPSFKIMSFPETALQNIENAARTCYQSWDFIKSGSAERLVKQIIDRNHLAMVEFGGDLVVRFIVDRGFTHELVRHRLASFAQESTRYCNYAKKDEIQCVVYPTDIPLEVYQQVHDEIKRLIDLNSTMDSIVDNLLKFDALKKYKSKKSLDIIYYVYGLIQSEKAYLERIKIGIQPQYARANLPIGVKTEIVIKANLREWRHIFALRTDPAAHPLIRTMMSNLLKDVKALIPIIFDDLGLDVDVVKDQFFWDKNLFIESLGIEEELWDVSLETLDRLLKKYKKFIGVLI